MRMFSLLYLLLLFSGFAFGQDIDVDFYRDLNNTINNFNLSDLASSGDGVIFLPTLYMNSRLETYVTFGLMYNNPEAGKNEKEIEAEMLEKGPVSVFRAAFYVKRRSKDVMLFFDYYNDYSWGLSVRLKF